MKSFPEMLEATARDVAERYRQAGYFPSASIRVFDREKTLAAVQVGQADGDSVFDVASCTKIATATQVLLLMEEGRLALEDPIGKHLEEIRADAYLRERMKDVTLFRLLTHTSTLVDWFPFYTRKGEDFFSVLRYALKHTRPTEGVKYSDLNFMLLGKLIERISGLSLPDALQKNLVEKYGLGYMRYRPESTDHLIPSGYGNGIEDGMCRDRFGLVYPYFRPADEPILGGVQDGNAHEYFDDAAGHAGIFATPEAYERLCRLYMNTEKPLLVRAQREQPGAPGRGLGFQTGLSYPYGCGHTGFTGTSIYFSREKNIGVVAFTNRLFYPYKNDNMTGDFRRALHEAVLALGENCR